MTFHAGRGALEKVGLSDTGPASPLFHKTADMK